ncbi:MAG: MFS transporter [Acidobacteriaceae bacterium]|nr:MFS transporter [Acidobacteriaceae bacterium]
MSRHGWVIFALSVTAFAIGTTEFTAMTVVPAVAEELRISVPQAGQAVSVYALGVVIGGPLLTALAASYSRKKTALLLLALFALGNASTVIVHSYSTLLISRFVAALPHAALLGIAALIAAEVVEPEQLSRAIGLVMLGLSVATVVGVPVAQWIGQEFGWRWSFGVVALVSGLALLLTWIFVPNQAPTEASSWRKELQTLKNSQVLLNLLVGALGYGGLFAVYTYLGPTLLHVTHASVATVPVELAIVGVGMTTGTLVLPLVASKALSKTIGWLLGCETVLFALFPLADTHLWSLSVLLFLLGNLGALAALLQTRLIEIADESKSVASALNHCAFNIANALGPFLAGLAITAGFGWGSSGIVGAGLCLAALLTLGVAVRKQTSITSN